jgi:hypothetical protein
VRRLDEIEALLAGIPGWKIGGGKRRTLFRVNLKIGRQMNLTVEIPDDLAGRLNASGGDLSRRALEALGLEEYKSGRITKAELRRLLGLSTRYELDGFLKAHEVWVDYTVEDFRRELQDLKRLGF